MVNKITKLFCSFNHYDFNVKRVLSARNRFFQRCLELGRFETANEKNAFHQYAPLQIYSKVCSDVFDLG